MPEKHALLSASAAARWLSCPPSARLCAEVADEGSTYAEEGTLAHAICETKLLPFVSIVQRSTVTRRLNKLKKHELYQPEMDGYTDVYVDYVKKTALSFPSKAHISVEHLVDYSNYAPEGFGTADCLIVHGEELHVIDFKYGKGVEVSPENNPQLKLYALGALNIYGVLYPIKEIHLHIVQPRLDNIAEWTIPTDELTAWGESIKPIAQEAFEGRGEFRSGGHCRFCKVRATCRKRAEDNLALAKFEFAKPASTAKNGEPTITDEEIGDVLGQARLLKKWAEDIEEYALSAILSGKTIDGWKAVEGRGSRQFTDTSVIGDRLKAVDLSPDIAFERRMLTVAQLEKAVGKSSFEQIFGDIVVKTKGKPTLALSTDKRPEYVPNTSAAEDFK